MIEKNYGAAGEAGKKRLPFYRSLLPWKGDSGRLVVSKLLFLFFCGVFLVCAAFLLNDFVLRPLEADKEQKDIAGVYYANSAPEGSAPRASDRDAQGRLIRFVNLQKINPDIVGWIRVPNTVIDLPVLQASKSSPEFYLNHDYNKKKSTYGSVFADARTPVAGGKSRSVILYGHSLRSGRMFTQLLKYKDLSFYRQNPVFTFDTVDGPSQWKIVSVFLTNTLPEQGKPFDYLKASFRDDSDYLNFVYQMRIRSLYETGVDFRADDSIVLLSTCSYEFDDFRQVVVARKVRSDESVSVDVKKASVTGKTVYPDCWYRKNGGTKPVWPDTYEEAVKQKLISWGTKA